MGDVGSTFLGALFAGFALKSNDFLEALWIISLAFPLLLDASTCIVRRFMAGLNIFIPHDLHLYQRLNQSGWSHAKISLIYLALTSLFCFSFIFNSFYFLSFNILLLILLGIWLDKYIAIPFDIASKRRIN
tara:strand:- start:94 stop:486 length:393 start_codon:yes stop_codon:yes gene_type:complete